MSRSHKSYPMLGGDGTFSYMRNSIYQKETIDVTKEKTRDCILENLHLFNLNPHLTVFTIADFGCSTGPNTFSAVQNIIDTVKLKHQDTENTLDESLEFQVFFNDQTNNDFNTLFRTQPPSSDHGYFTAGVPGSFYGRLLPRNSLHIGHTSTTIHWLSKVPDKVCDKKSPAWNKTYIQCNYILEETTKAYKVQFIKDTRAFLEARAEELVPGGLMIMLGLCLPDDVPMSKTLSCMLVDMIGDCLMDMAKSGEISEEKIELFSLPIYFPKYSVLKREIGKNKSFKIETMESMKHPMEHMVLPNDFIISMFRAILNTVIEQHFGDGVGDEVFDRLAKKLIKHPIDFKECKEFHNYFVLLKRN